MLETWFRGQSTKVAPAKPGACLHDFGDGLYFADSKDVAIRYAQMRVSEGGGEMQVLTMSVERTELGKVLDLSANANWDKFMKAPAFPGGPTHEALIRMANENYGRLFDAFLKAEKIDLREFDGVIGPEFVRGGRQLCILDVRGQRTPRAEQLLRSMRPVRDGFEPTPVRMPSVPAEELTLPSSPWRRAAGNQAGMAMLGTLLAAGLHALGDYGIQRQAQRAIETTLADGIAQALAQGLGVLVIVAVEEALQPDFNGFRARLYLTSYMQAGASQAQALQAWRGQDRLLQGASKGFYVTEDYLWIEPRRL